MANVPEMAVYEIRIRGHLDRRRARQFAGMTITPRPGGETILVGPVLDQAALYGLLSRIRDLGTPLISVQRRELEDVGRDGQESAIGPGWPS